MSAMKGFRIGALIAVAVVVAAGTAAADGNGKLDQLRTKRLVAKFHASGVQQYECNGKEWVFKGPAAVLSDEKGKPVAVHYQCENCDACTADKDDPTKGKTRCGTACDPKSDKKPAFAPAWNFFDGGFVDVAEKLEAVPAKDKGAVPYLALKLENNAKGKIAQADTVLRVATVGGIPPKEQCSTPYDEGKWFAAKYQADYEFRDSTQDAPAAASGTPAGAKKAPGGTTEVK